jgi:hypothetical protein
MEICFVFTPKNPQVFTLNTTAWLSLELCDGSSLRRIERVFLAAIGASMSRDEARQALRNTLRYLEEKGIVSITRA